MHKLLPLLLRLLTTGALLALLTTAGLSPGQAAAQDNHLWTFDYKKGDTEKFRTIIRINGRLADGSGDFAIVLKSVSHHEFKEVSADGTATYDQIDDKREVSFNGMPAPVKPEDLKPVTITLSKTGIMLKRVNPAADPNSVRDEKSILAIQSLPVPDKAVKVGDTWKSEFPNPLLKGKTVTATSTLVGVEKILDTDALKIKLQMDIPTAPDAVEREIIVVQETYYLDVKTHHLLRAIYLIKNPMIAIPGSKVQARALVSRIVPGVNEKEDADADKLLADEKK